MSDVLGVSISGLRVSQNALRTAGHNIANADTEGYSRQSTEINSLGGVATGAGFIGSGSYTSQIERIVNNFVTGQVRQDTTLYNEYSAYNTHILQLNDVLANSATGLSEGLESFFAALQNVTDDPTSTSSRQLLISEGENLADRFNTIYERVDIINDSVNESLSVAVETVNTLTATIAQLNKSISAAMGSTGEQAVPNDLLDQRDQALLELSELVSVQTVEQGNMVNVTVGNGLPLVVGTDVTRLTLGSNEFDPLQPEIYQAGLTQPITGQLSGGEIGGLLEVQSDVLKTTLNDLGQIALAISEEFNDLQSQGITLNNTFGENFFQDINDPTLMANRVFPSSQNATSDQIVTLAITDTSQITTSDYRLSISPNSNVYSVVRLDDGVEVASNIMPVSFPASIEFDGLSFDIQSGTYSNGDEFLIQPTRFAARDFSTAALQPADIALGSPILGETSLGNLGSAEISSGEVLSILDANGVTLPMFASAGQLSPPLLIKFTTATTYDILDNSDPGNPVQLDPPIRNQIYVPGIQNSLFTEDSGQTTVVSNGTALGLPTGSTAAAVGTGTNGYDAETFTFVTTDPVTGSTSSQTVFTSANDSAKTIAGLLSNVNGVSANAFTTMELRDFSVSLTAPLQITLNGQDLVAYDTGTIASTVPDPALNSGEDFNDYLAEQINNNTALTNLGIYAVSAYDAANSEYYIQVHSTQGDDLTVELEAAAGEVIEVNDGTNADVALTGAGAGTVTEVVVGGQIDVQLAANLTMSTAGTEIFNAAVAQSSFWGIQANITGTPVAGDTFTIGYNEDAAMDNRNGLQMVNLQQSLTMSGTTESFGSSYNRLVEDIGIKTNSSELNTEAAENVLEQSISLRDSISGVNLDEEAGDLIRFEQLYQANAQVISVARELFDRLLNSF